MFGWMVGKCRTVCCRGVRKGFQAGSLRHMFTVFGLAASSKEGLFCCWESCRGRFSLDIAHQNLSLENLVSTFSSLRAMRVRNELDVVSFQQVSRIWFIVMKFRQALDSVILLVDVSFTREKDMHISNIKPVISTALDSSCLAPGVALRVHTLISVIVLASDIC